MRTVVRFYLTLQAPVPRPVAYPSAVASLRRPVGVPSPAARADASRNRELLLCTARRLVAEVGVEALSMDALAAEAGLGKGTVFRRFGSRAGLFAALLDASEQDFQREFMTGPPPLGPGADPVDRMVAFGRRRLEFLDDRGDLVRAAAGELARHPQGPAALGRLHLRVLLRDAGVTGDVEILAHHLHSALEMPLWRIAEGGTDVSPERLRDGWSDLVHRVVGR